MDKIGEVMMHYGDYKTGYSEAVKNVKANYDTVTDDDVKQIKKDIEEYNKTQGKGDKEVVVNYDDILTDHFRKPENTVTARKFLNPKPKVLVALKNLGVSGLAERFEGLHVQLEQVMGKLLRGHISPKAFENFHKNVKEEMERFSYHARGEPFGEGLPELKVLKPRRRKLKK